MVGGLPGTGHVHKPLERQDALEKGRRPPETRKAGKQILPETLVLPFAEKKNGIPKEFLLI